MLDIELLEELKGKKEEAIKEYNKVYKQFKERGKEIAKRCSDYGVCLKNNGNYYMSGFLYYGRYDILDIEVGEEIINIKVTDIDYDETGVIEIKKEDFIKEKFLVELKGILTKVKKEYEDKKSEEGKEKELKELERLKNKYDK